LQEVLPVTVSPSTTHDWSLLVCIGCC
jgi:hypothetical protein